MSHTPHSGKNSLDELKKRLAAPQKLPEPAIPIFSQNFGATAKKAVSHGQFYRIVLALIILFFILAGTIVYLSITKKTEQTKTQNTMTQKQAEDAATRTKLLGDALTGGSMTLATKARVNKETMLPKDWLKQNFMVRPGALDVNNSCVQESVCGPSVDPDNDGLINILEYNFGTDPNNADTDNDGISDGDELLVYYSHPKMKDSNIDGVSDAEELVACVDMTGVIKGLLYSNDALATISTNISLYPLHEPTITTFRVNGGTVSDIQNSGYFKTKCETAKNAVDMATSPSAGATSSSTTSLAPESAASSVAIPPPVESPASDQQF